MKTVDRGGAHSHSDCKSAIMTHLKSRFGNSGLSAYELSKRTGYTPQHCNRTLKELFRSGLVGFKIVPARNGEKRVWKAASIARFDKEYITPDYVQTEMFEQ